MRAVILSLHDVRRGNGGTARTDAFAAAFASLGWDTVYVCPAEGLPEADVLHGVEYLRVSGRPVGQREWPVALRAIKRVAAPLPTRRGAYSAELFEALVGLGPVDVLVVPSANATSYARALPSARLWLDFHDVMSAFARREARFLPPPARATARAQARLIARQEEAESRRAAVVTVAGFTDCRLLSAAGRCRATWLPNPVSPAGPVPPVMAGYAGLLADFGYWPNQDALDMLVTEWLAPLERSGWQVVVAGRRSSHIRLPETVLNLGEVESVEEFYRHTEIAVVPVRRGGGMKVKLVEALIHGRPVIATKFATEGFESLPATLQVDGRLSHVPRQLFPPSTAERERLRDQFSTERFCRSVEQLSGPVR